MKKKYTNEEIKERTDLFLKGMNSGFKHAYRDIRDLMNERLRNIKNKK